jgi:histidinol phosphatase-like enzyme
MSKAEKAFKLQEKIGELIGELEKLGFEFMFFNNQSSIRRKR